MTSKRDRERMVALLLFREMREVHRVVGLLRDIELVRRLPEVKR